MTNTTDWIEWDGGECPVVDDVLVVIRFRDGSERKATPAVQWAWGHINCQNDIIAYRVVTAKDEAPDLDLSKPVGTKNGHEVWIAATDAPGDKPVIGKHRGNEFSWFTCSWTREGYFGSSEGSELDLVNVPEKPFVPGHFWVAESTFATMKQLIANKTELDYWRARSVVHRIPPPDVLDAIERMVEHIGLVVDQDDIDAVSKFFNQDKADDD